MAHETLYKTCPLCIKAPVSLQSSGEYSCAECGLTIKERSILGLFKKGQYSIVSLGQQPYNLVEPILPKLVLPADPLKIVLGNIYTDQALADIAGGHIDVIRPVKTVLAQIILEQLKEACLINANNLRRGQGQPLSGNSLYNPTQKAPRQNMDWQDEGNLFCTNQRIVFPSDQFTFIRLDRKLTVVQAFADGVAVQRKDEAFATYFVGCYPHEAALVAAYVMARVPALRPAEAVKPANNAYSAP